MILVSIVFAACGEDDSPPTGVYDREAMLRNYADEIIIPAYTDLLASSTNLEAALLTLIKEPSVTNLSIARNQFEASLVTWQNANAFNFGPAGEEGMSKRLVEEIGTFPVNTEKVDGFIAANDTSLANFDRDSRGFYAIGYMLYGVPGESTDILSKLENEPYKAYLRSIARALGERISEVLSEWNGSYKDGFISRSGTDVGSGTSELYNEFVRSFEAIKNFKVGLPLGRRPGQTSSEPDLVESRFAGISRSLIGVQLQAIERIYKGQKADGTEGQGLQDYLETVEGGPALVSATLEQWEKVMNAYNALPQDRSLAELAAEEAPELDAFHTELQKHTRFFKSDMSSILGIAITFASGDGD